MCAILYVQYITYLPPKKNPYSSELIWYLYDFIIIANWLSSDLKLKEHMRDLSNKLGLFMVSVSVGVYRLDSFLGSHMDLLALCDGEISVLRGGMEDPPLLDCWVERLGLASRSLSRRMSSLPGCSVSEILFLILRPYFCNTISVTQSDWLTC